MEIRNEFSLTFQLSAIFADGDTITVLRNKEQIKIRLYGIDIPEKRQTFGTKAKRFTSSMAGK